MLYFDGCVAQVVVAWSEEKGDREVGPREAVSAGSNLDILIVVLVKLFCNDVNIETLC